MTLEELKAAFADLHDFMGGSPREVSLVLGSNFTDPSLTLTEDSRYRSGRVREPFTVSVRGETFEEMFAKARVIWDEHRMTADEGSIREMALDIIQLTYEFGECNEAALRQNGKFSARQIDDYKQLAIDRANTMAERGPFSVVEAASSNGAPAYGIGDEEIPL